MSQILDFLRGKRVAKSAVIVNGDVVDTREIQRNTALRDLFLATTALRDQTQRAHWEVTGAGATFSELHEMFGDQYSELADAVDELAERIRQLRGDVPTTYGSMNLGDAVSADGSSQPLGIAMELGLSHERLSGMSAKLARLADEAGDAATVDLASRRMAAHEKAAWFLRMTAGIPDEAGRSWVVMDDLEGERLWKTSVAKAVTRDLIGETKQVVSLRDALTKAAPKYVKRVPTGNPKRPWRYFYAVQHGGGVHNQAHFTEGASFAHDGGHYQIHGVGADHLVVSHSSDPDKRMKMTHSELAGKLQEHHGKALAAHRAKLDNEHAEAVAAGNEKGAAKIRAEAAKVGHSIAEPKKPGVSGKQARKRPSKPAAQRGDESAEARGWRAEHANEDDSAEREAVMAALEAHRASAKIVTEVEDGVEAGREQHPHTRELDDKIAALEKKAARLGGPTDRESKMAESFPLGGGFGHGSQRSRDKAADRSIDRAKEYTETKSKLNSLKARRKAFVEGRVDERGREIAAKPEPSPKSEARERAGKLAAESRRVQIDMRLDGRAKTDDGYTIHVDESHGEPRPVVHLSDPSGQIVATKKGELYDFSRTPDMAKELLSEHRKGLTSAGAVQAKDDKPKTALESKIKELDDKAAASLAANPGMDDKIRSGEKKTDDAWIKEHAARSAEHAKPLGKHPSEMMGDEHVADHWDGGAPPKGTSKADREDADKAQQIANQRRAVRGKQIARNADKIVPKQKVEHSLDSTSANMSGAAWTPNPEGNGRGTMRVRFKGGDTYDHKDVHHRDYESVINGDHEGSPGKTYNLMIRDRHESNRVMRGTRGQTPINTEGKPEQAREENRKANIVARNEAAGKDGGAAAKEEKPEAAKPEAAKSVDEHIATAAKTYGLSSEEADKLKSHPHVDTARKSPDKAEGYVRLAVKDHLSRDRKRNMSPSTAERFMREREKGEKIKKALGNIFAAIRQRRSTD